MLENNWIKILSLIFLSIAIALSPSFSAGQLSSGKIIEIRVEDIFIAILGLAWIVSLIVSRKKIERIKKAPLFFPILAWLGFGLLTTSANWMLGNLKIWQGFFYFLKEVEFFFLYFYFFYCVKTIFSAKRIIWLWIFLGLANAGYVVYQIITNVYSGGYGAGAVCELGVFPSGAFFLILFIFLFNVFLYYFLNLDISKFKKGLIGTAIISPVFGSFASCSKTVFLATIFALFLTMFFLFLRKSFFRPMVIIFFALIFIAGIFTVRKVPDCIRTARMLSPIRTAHDFERERIEPIKSVFDSVQRKKDILLPVLGLGKGYVWEAHNQYLRNFIEDGIIGSIIFLILIFAIIKRAFSEFSKSRSSLSVGLSGGLLVATFTMLFCSFVTEPFIVVKVSEVYWVFAAISMAVLVINKQKENYVK